MKFENYFGLSRPALVAKTLISGVALSALLGLSLNVQAQTCTIGNWDAATGLTNADAGTQGANNRRYGGPCGLRVPGGTPAYLTDNSPATEDAYIARFYAFLNNAGSDPVLLFSADDEIQVWYNVPAAGDLTLRAFDSGLAANDATFPAAAVGAGWHSIEFAWAAASPAAIRFTVDGVDAPALSIDTSGIAISSAQLGDINGTATGPIDLDDFDSRRQTPPGRLLVGDATNDGVVNAFDIQAVGNEVFGGAFAAGQPDCNEDGTINAFDIQCVGNLVFN